MGKDPAFPEKNEGGKSENTKLLQKKERKREKRPKHPSKKTCRTKKKNKKERRCLEEVKQQGTDRKAIPRRWTEETNKGGRGTRPGRREK